MLTNNTSTKFVLNIYNLSALWMSDHIEVWNEEEFGPAPTGRFRGNVWTGSLDERQLAEVISRAKSYANPYGPDAEGAKRYVQAAKRVLKVLGVSAGDVTK